MVKRKKQTSYFVPIDHKDLLRIYNNLLRIYEYEFYLWEACNDCPAIFINSIINRIDLWQQKDNSVIFWCFKLYDYIEVCFNETDLYNIGLVSDYFQLNLNPDNKIKKIKSNNLKCKCHRSTRLRDCD